MDILTSEFGFVFPYGTKYCTNGKVSITRKNNRFLVARPGKLTRKLATKLGRIEALSRIRRGTLFVSGSNGMVQAWRFRRGSRKKTSIQQGRSLQR